DKAARHGDRHGDRVLNTNIGRSLAIRDAARNAASVTVPEGGYVARLLRADEPSRRPIVLDPAPASPRRLSFADILAYGVAVGLAGCAAWFSLKGLAVLFPGAPVAIVVMGGVMEAAKLVACGWLAGAWGRVPWIFRGVLMLLIAGL